MTVLLNVIALLAAALFCNGLEEMKPENENNRRLLDLPAGAVIMGAPSHPSHLPEAEPILPGHTLIRPGIGMLKSALKFPHRELEGGSGVYGNEDNLGLRYGGLYDRVPYTGFRRSNIMENAGIILIIPKTNGDGKNISTTNLATIKMAQEALEDLIKVGRTTDEEKLLETPTYQNPRTDKTKKRRPGFFRPAMVIDKEEEEEDIYTRNFPLFAVLNSNEDNVVEESQSDEIQNKKKTKEEMIFSKKLPKWTNFMGHYRKNNDFDELLDALRTYPHSQRRQQEFVVKKPARDGVLYRIEDDSGDDGGENINLMKSVEATFDIESQTAMPRKQELFWKTKDLFTHIKIDQHAPEYSEFIPIKIEADELANIRNWWFYNQADHKEMEE